MDKAQERITVFAILVGGGSYTTTTAATSPRRLGRISISVIEQIGLSDICRQNVLDIHSL